MASLPSLLSELASARRAGRRGGRRDSDSDADCDAGRRSTGVGRVRVSGPPAPLGAQDASDDDGESDPSSSVTMPDDGLAVAQPSESACTGGLPGAGWPPREEAAAGAGRRRFTGAGRLRGGGRATAGAAQRALASSGLGAEAVESRPAGGGGGAAAREGAGGASDPKSALRRTRFFSHAVRPVS